MHEARSEEHRKIELRLRKEHADRIKPFIHEGKLRLMVRHFECGCGQMHGDYVVPAEQPLGTSSLTVQEVIDALDMRDGDVLVIEREKR